MKDNWNHGVSTKMGNGFNIDINGIKSILNQLFKSKPSFPITEKSSLIRALGGETNLLKINSANELASAVLLAEAAFDSSQVFQNSNDIIDGILGGSFINAFTKSKLYTDINDLTFPVKHEHELDKLKSTLQLYGYQWNQIKQKMDLPLNSPADLIFALSSLDPSLVSTDVSIIKGLEIPDLSKIMGESPPAGTHVSAPETIPQEPPAPAPPLQAPPPQQPATNINEPAFQPPPPQVPGHVEERPTPEAPGAPAGPTVDLKFGFSYIIKEDKPKACFETMSEGTKAGYNGLCITRTHPKQIREKFALGNININWLTDRKSSEETTLSPALENIAYLIEGFVKKNDKCIVLIDGLEYLISVNKFNPVLAFVRRIVDFVSEREAIIMIPISPLTIGEQELKTLEREMEPIAENEVLVLPHNKDQASVDPSTTEPEVASQDVSQAPSSSDSEKSCTPCEGTGRCFWCAGTGSCETCTGTGKTETGEDCENCSGSGICDSCKGSKSCIWCKGTGKMIES